LALVGMHRHLPPRWAWLQSRSFLPVALGCLDEPQYGDLLRLLLPRPTRLRRAPYTSGFRGCGPRTAGNLPGSAACCPSIPPPRRRGVLRGGASRGFASSMAFAWHARLGSPLSRTGSHHGAAGFTSWCGLLGCTSFPEGDAASAPSVAQEPWEPATWLSGDYHDRTFTGKQTVTFKAHHAVVRQYLFRRPSRGLPAACAAALKVGVRE
jgi:hypothetical protein